MLQIEPRRIQNVVVLRLTITKTLQGINETRARGARSEANFMTWLCQQIFALESPP
jgi:hypothetical protein